MTRVGLLNTLREAKAAVSPHLKHSTRTDAHISIQRTIDDEYCKHTRLKQGPAPTVLRNETPNLAPTSSM
jgi:hypothetical protein